MSTAQARRDRASHGTLALTLALLLAAASIPSPSARAAPPAPAGLRAALAVRGEAALAAEDADRRVAPASLVKALVAAAALDALGPEHRAVTVLAAPTAPRGDGTVAGDLVLVAGGDPTWNQRFFPERARRPEERLAAALVARGVRRVEGDLVLDLSRFPGRDTPPGRALSELAYAWAAPASGLAVDENAVAVRIAPGSQIGAPGTATLEDPSPPGAPPLVVEIATVGADRHERGTVDFLPLWRRGALWVRGEYPLSEPPYRVLATVPDPVGYAGAALRAALERHGVEIAGTVRVSSTPVPAAVELARVASPPLAEWLPPILGDSHNWYAEMLLRQLALATTGAGRIDDGLERVRAFLEARAGVAPGSVRLLDGSGLSADALVTPRAVVATLRYVWRQPWRDAFLDALARPGTGTLEHWPRLGAVAAKTGTRQGNQALAGYLWPGGEAVDPAETGAEPVIFAIVLDHRGEPGPALRAEIAAWLRGVARSGASSHPGDSK